MEDNLIKVSLPINLPPGAKTLDVQSIRKVIERSRQKQLERTLRIKQISPLEPIDFTKVKSNRLNLPDVFGHKSTDYVDYDKLTPEEERRRVMVSEHPQIFNCCFCSFTTEDQTSYRLHIGAHLQQKRMECKQCNFSTENVSIFNKHSNEAHRKNVATKIKYGCPKCSFRSFSLKTLMKHKELMGHGRRKQDLLKCQLCKFVSADISKLVQHVDKHSRAPEACPACDDQLDYGEMLHSVNCFKVTDPVRYMYVESFETPSKKNYTCTLCEFKCGDLLHLMAHIRAHVESSVGNEDSNNMAFCCTMCDFKCDMPSELASHMEGHNHMSSGTSQADSIQTPVPETAEPISIKTDLVRMPEDSGSETDHVTREQEIVKPFN